MRSDKEEAIALRRQGKSYRQIKEKLGVPKSTLATWLSGEKWSQEVARVLSEQAKAQNGVRMRALDKIRGEHLARVYEEARAEATHEFEDLKYHPLFIAALMLYWGEGDRVSVHGVRLGNTDPKMLRVFFLFLRDICQIPPERIKAAVLIYPDLNEQECRSFWANEIGIPEFQFQKVITIKGRHKSKRLAHGVCTVVVTSRYLKEKMLIWLDLFAQELVSKKYYN